MTQIKSSTADRIAVLCRLQDVEPDLAHKLRTAAHRGRMTAEQAATAIALLRKLPPRGKP
jgi:hypothetical protein